MRKHTAPVGPQIDANTTLFLRMNSVVRLTGLGRTTIYRLVADKNFPGPVRLSKRAIGWRRVDLERWCEARESAGR